jgi:thioredoxin family protein
MDRTRPLFALAALLAGCIGSPYEGSAGSIATSQRSTTTAVKPEFVAVPTDQRPVDEVVRAAQAQAKADERRLLVYVGAAWCEPCQVFHKAVEAGRLDAELAGVRFLEFDSDIDSKRLAAAGYGGDMIPRFALPGADGRGTDAKIEGGVKGEAAVGHIMARLKDLLAKA